MSESSDLVLIAFFFKIHFPFKTLRIAQLVCNGTDFSFTWPLFIYLFTVLRVEPRAPCMLGKCLPTVLYCQYCLLLLISSHNILFFIVKE